MTRTILALGFISMLAACGGSTDGEATGSGGAAGSAGAAGNAGSMTTTNGMGGSPGTGGGTTSTGGSAGKGTGGNDGSTLPDGGCTYDDPNKMYITRSPNNCAAIDVGCPIGSKGFMDSCGCGCEKAACEPPPGMGCCSGDVVMKGRCDDGGYACPAGYMLRPVTQCVLPMPDGGPKPGDGGSDAKSCLPKGMVCCNGDVIGTSWCDEGDAIFGCTPGYVLKPIEQCTTPPPDGGKG